MTSNHHTLRVKSILVFGLQQPLNDVRSLPDNQQCNGDEKGTGQARNRGQKTSRQEACCQKTGSKEDHDCSQEACSRQETSRSRQKG